MAIIGLFIGSVLGFFGAALLWLALDVSFLSAVGIYFATALSFGLIPVLGNSMRSAPMLAMAPVNTAR
ncbi:hypothetical protein GCM10011415_31700 [Salipiger pallidus]|uniref:Uncharacterized protein n=1 Tax=Salipiger pallidus TaxID=1775170 RepID=A0A8J2ZM77_9RHOB|nr:hypothetical protein [Salipiger pallidus]GGG80035.1 hypothetical protein GCM10011415_31700 [Salipiger pallidus]